MSKEIVVPDIGDFTDVEVIEVLIAAGDTIATDDSLISIESDKAVMEIPAPEGGVVKELRVKVGDRVSQGSPILLLEPSATDSAAPAVPQQKTPGKTAPRAQPVAEKKPAAVPAPRATAPQAGPAATALDTANFARVSFSGVYASPAVRRFARELGVDLGRVQGTGRKGRIIKEDVQSFVKQALAQGVGGGGMAIAPPPDIDFSQWGEIESQPLTKINKLTGQYLHRNWVTIPHVTQFDEADITDLEAFRKSMIEEHKDKGIKITMLAFLMKAAVSGLKEYPRFNSSLDNNGENLIYKKYFNVGVAVDTADGLVVPVIREVDCKSLVDIAAELGEVSQKARDKKLKPADMQGGCITISSLGGIGGTKFTPIVNLPEVAILGVSRARMQAVWSGKEFTPRLMLPLSLSYDHRVIDGADAARFTTFLCSVLADARRMLL
jgi:pyruvate dehydrogenase E2 component (dihydrolipoyllysine-residue acetyltransferase)